MTVSQGYITEVLGAATGAAGGCTMTVWSAALAAHVGAPAGIAISANPDIIVTHSVNLSQMNYVAGHQAWIGTT